MSVVHRAEGPCVPSLPQGSLLSSVSEQVTCPRCKPAPAEVKPRLALLPWRALVVVARVLTHGEDDPRHTGAGHWSQLSVRHHLDAALRHVAAHLAGTERDAGTGERHLAHAAARLLFALLLDGAA